MMTSKKILIVDKNLEIRELVRVTLGLGKYEVLQVLNGMQVVETVIKEQPDLVIMDVMNPSEKDHNIQATRILKNRPETQNCKIIFFSGWGCKFDEDICFKAGADDYFSKPFKLSELIKKVEQVLHG
jgi:CheY-like chemotaxis protein